MAKSLSARLGLQRWTAGTDTQLRSEFDNDNAQLEALAAIARQGLASARGSATTWSRSTYLATDTGVLSYSDGAAWTNIAYLGAWTPYTPTLSNLTLGNGSMSAAYLLVGKDLRVRFRLTLGSTSAVGTNAGFSLPVPIVSTQVLAGSISDASTNVYDGSAICSGSTATFLSSVGVLTASSPFVWTTGDSLGASGSLEAA